MQNKIKTALALKLPKALLESAKTIKSAFYAFKGSKTQKLFFFQSSIRSLIEKLFIIISSVILNDAYIIKYAKTLHLCLKSGNNGNF